MVRPAFEGGAGIQGSSGLGGAAKMSDRDGKPDPSPSEWKDLSAKLGDLDRRLDKSRAAREADKRTETQPARPGMAMALRLGADFVAGVVLGAAIGWGFDKFLGTSPWGLVVFLLLGFAAGILSVMRSAGLVKPGPRGPDDVN
jgi:ATP synthase protein I